MHNDEVRKLSTNKSNTRDSPKGGFLNSFINLMKLKDDEEYQPNECYESDKDEKIGRILITISLLIPVMGIIMAITIAIISVI